MLVLKIAKIYHYVSLLSVVCKIIEKLKNTRLFDHLEKCGLFTDFRNDFRFSWSTADLLIDVSDRIARVFNTWFTQGFQLGQACWSFSQTYGISSQIFGLISSFLSNRWFRVDLDWKSSQWYPVNAGVPQGSISGPTPFLLFINSLPDDAFCYVAIYGDNTTLYSKFDQSSDLWQQLEMAAELESDLQCTVDWGRKCLDVFNGGKTQFVSFDQSNNTNATEPVL